ncbi:MAG: polymer-forming cytoskeletal protein [Anaerolineales bacterium]
MTLFGGKRAQKTALSVMQADETGQPGGSAPKAPMMARKTVGFETVIGANTTLHGELRTQADVRIDGTFEGTLEIEGNVLVGETGKVSADIHAKNVSVAGAVRGDISGKKVQILRSARVWGNISASAITTEEGAFIDGKLSMTQHEASVQTLAATTLPMPEAHEATPLQAATQTDQADDDLEIVEGEPVDENDETPSDADEDTPPKDKPSAL